MKQRNLSLRLYVAAAFLLLGIALVTGFSMLSAHYYIRGMDSIVAAYLEDMAEHYLDSVPAENRGEVYPVMGNTLAETFESLPVNVREAFRGRSTFRANVLYQNRGSSRWRKPTNLYFLMRYQRGSEQVFVTRYVNRESASPLVQELKQESGRLLLLVSLGSAMVLAGIIWLLLRQVSKPMVRLGRWTRRLTAEKLKLPVPDFTYPELNDMAQLIRTSLSSVQETLDREQRFLRHASHELRTPISVVRNNVELMRKLQSCKAGHCDADSREQQVIDRIDRASLTMKHLTETLLWLSREENEVLATQTVELGKLLQLLSEVMQYLLNDKTVTVRLQTDDTVLELAEAPVKIVLGNLLRNAYQHCWNGEVRVLQRGATVTLSNPIPEPSEQSKSDPGFGLGLELTERLTRRMGWQYEHETRDGVYHASVTFVRNPPS